MKKALLILTCAALAASGASAADPQGDQPKLVCKKDRQGVDTGSNLRRASKRICKTQAEWAELERDAQQTFRRIDDTATRQRAATGR